VVAGAAVAEDQELEYSRISKGATFQAYVDGLAAVLHSPALAAAAEIEDGWVQVDHAPSIGAMDASSEKDNSPWSVLKIKKDMSRHPGPA